MGLSDDGDDPAPLAQTGGPRARVYGSDQDIVALVVPGSTGIKAEFDLISMRASDLAGPVSSIESPVGSSAKRWM